MALWALAGVDTFLIAWNWNRPLFWALILGVLPLGGAMIMASLAVFWGEPTTGPRLGGLIAVLILGTLGLIVLMARVCLWVAPKLSRRHVGHSNWHTGLFLIATFGIPYVLLALSREDWVGAMLLLAVIVMNTLRGCAPKMPRASEFAQTVYQARFLAFLISAMAVVTGWQWWRGLREESRVPVALELISLTTAAVLLWLVCWAMIRAKRRSPHWPGRGES